MVLEFPSDEGEDKSQQSQSNVICKDATNEDDGAFVALKNNLDVLSRGVLDGVWREDDEPHRARYGLNQNGERLPKKPEN